MIEPFDAQRHEALLTTMPIQPITPTGLTVHLIIEPGSRRAARCGDPEACLGTTDGRLVNCHDCRADTPGAWFTTFGEEPPEWLLDS